MSFTEQRERQMGKQAFNCGATASFEGFPVAGRS